MGNTGYVWRCTETHAEDKAEFYLVSVIVSGVREEGNTK